jgi:hypothetical protein
MNATINKLLGFRRYLLEQLVTLNISQFNEIPERHNNNIIWNITHLIAVQQMMCYTRSGLPVVTEDRFFTPFLSGTKPDAFIPETDIATILGLFTSTIERLQSDFDAGRFTEYSASAMIPKVYGFPVADFDAALEYLLYHEGLHAGTVLCLKRLVVS